MDRSSEVKKRGHKKKVFSFACQIEHWDERMRILPCAFVLLRKLAYLSVLFVLSVLSVLPILPDCSPRASCCCGRSGGLRLDLKCKKEKKKKGRGTIRPSIHGKDRSRSTPSSPKGHAAFILQRICTEIVRINVASWRVRNHQ